MTTKTDKEKSEIDLIVGDIMRSFLNKWAGIFITTLIILITGSTTAGIISVSNKESIKEIKEDYMPYWAVVYIIESNNKLMNRWNAIESKDDAKIQQSLKEWNELQMEVIKQKGKIKTRSIGGASSISGGQ